MGREAGQGVFSGLCPQLMHGLTSPTSEEQGPSKALRKANQPEREDKIGPKEHQSQPSFTPLPESRMQKRKKLQLLFSLLFAFGRIFFSSSNKAESSQSEGKTTHLTQIKKKPNISSIQLGPPPQTRLLQLKAEVC